MSERAASELAVGVMSQIVLARADLRKGDPAERLDAVLAIAERDARALIESLQDVGGAAKEGR